MLVELNKNEINWIKEEVLCSLENCYEGNINVDQNCSYLLEQSIDMFSIPEEEVLMITKLGKKLIEALGE